MIQMCLGKLCFCQQKNCDTNKKENKTAIECVKMLKAEYGNAKIWRNTEHNRTQENEDLKKSIFDQYLD